MSSLNAEVVVLGSGPGGYTAAFRASDLGCNVTLIDKNTSFGGVCLNRGCIPSKALLYLSHLIDETTDSKNKGVSFNKPIIDIKKITHWKNSIIENLSNGISSLARKRNINVINGLASFLSAQKLLIIDKQNKNIKIEFDFCIIASGSYPSKLKNIMTEHPGIINSTQALSVNKIPEKMLVIGGGYIGLELGSVYNSFGSKITVAEYLPNFLSMADKDLVDPLYKKLTDKFSKIYLSTEVKNLKPQENKIIATFKSKEKIYKDTFDSVLISTGRTPNTKSLHLDKVGIKVPVVYDVMRYKNSSDFFCITMENLMRENKPLRLIS